MNRVLIVGGFGVLFLGLGLVGTNLMTPSLFGASTVSTPSLHQLSEQSARLDETNLRIGWRIEMKQELLSLWNSGTIGLDEVVEHWVWLNNQKPLYTSAINIMFPGMSSRQVALLQMLYEMEQWMNDSVSPENLDYAKIELSIVREAVISASLPLARFN